VHADPGDCLYAGDGAAQELTGAPGSGMRAFMLRAAGWADNDACRRKDWSGPSVSALGDVLPLVDAPAT
jgi:putative hydrolase of the HAD superfamily